MRAHGSNVTGARGDKRGAAARRGVRG